MAGLEKLYIDSFRGIRDLYLEQLCPINLVVGNNNSGKTSVLEAIEFLRFYNAGLINVLQIARQRDYQFAMEYSNSIYENVMCMFPQNLPIKQIELSGTYNGEAFSYKFHGENKRMFYNPSDDLKGIGKNRIRTASQGETEVDGFEGGILVNFGKEFISGTIDIATDEEGLNVIPIHFTYVTEITNSGKTNATFTNLKNIINGARTWMTDGKDMALRVRCNTSLGLNDFYNQNDELVSAKRNEGGFVSTVKDLVPEDERNTFKFDMVITSVTRVEANPEAGIDSDFDRIKGAVFDFRKSLLKHQASILLNFNRDPYNCPKCDTKMNFVLCIN